MPLPAANFATLVELVFADQRAGRIRRRVDDDALRARRDRVEEQIGRQREAVLGVRVDDHRRRVRELDLLGDRRPAGRVRDHFIARAEQRERWRWPATACRPR